MDINKEGIERLKKNGEETLEFFFWARPISSFPTTKVLYLYPISLTPIEKMREELLTSFPRAKSDQEIPPVYHMTIALDYSPGEEEKITQEYFQKFGNRPLHLRVGRLGVYIFTRGKWRKFFSIKPGKKQ